MNPSTHLAAAHAQLQHLVARFANSLDLKDWPGLGACLADAIHTDYSDLRGTAPETVTRDSFVAFRQSGLSTRDTHHLTGNVQLAVSGAEAEIVASMLVYIREPDRTTQLVHCVYFMAAECQAGAWRIHRIRQQLLLK